VTVRGRRPAGALVLILAISACAHLGPGTVVADRFDYNTAIADSWKEQTLLNIVKIRYADLPIFLDVSSIVTGYSLDTGATIGGQITGVGGAGNHGAASGSVNGTATYSQHPTITYTPMTGDKFLQGLITPIDPVRIFFLIQAGYSADFILSLTVESINGVHNRSTLGQTVRPADPEFMRVLQLLREVQLEGGVGVRVEESKEKGPTNLLFFRRDNLPASTREALAEIRRLLHLPATGDRFRLTYSPMPGGPDELSVSSRSMLQVLMAFASYVEVPPEDLRNKVAAPEFERSADQEVGQIRSGTTKPASSFAAVRYRGYWFWVDDSAWATKRALTTIMFFFTLTETDTTQRVPLVTIPAR
jgi:hypothetical protein